MMKKISLLILLIVCISTFSFAHGDLDERILETSLEIKKYPDSAYLYFKRGKLYFQHNEYKKSIKDLKKSKNLDFQDGEQTLLFSRNYFRLEKFKKSLSYSKTILESDPHNVLAIKIKAQALLNLEEYQKSALSYEDVINYTIKSFPENYIDASVAWEKLNTEEGYKRAITIVENGIDKLGELISLYERLIDLSLKQKKYKLAINYQLHVLTLLPRKERAYFKLAELYELDNDLVKASENIALAKEHFSKLPIRIQNTSFMKDLLEAIKTKETNN